MLSILICERWLGLPGSVEDDLFSPNIVLPINLLWR